MIIALHGVPAEMIFSLFGAFITIVIYMIWVHYSVYKTKYYNDEFKYFTVEKRLILYLSFLLANLFVAFLLFWLLTFIFATLIFR
ncbi:cell division protein FtsL [Flavobacterium sp. HSC-32F16]|nr:cell division protein FtsL [Flavobacterium sp. HSC-32F16]